LLYVSKFSANGTLLAALPQTHTITVNTAASAMDRVIQVTPYISSQVERPAELHPTEFMPTV